MQYVSGYDNIDTEQLRSQYLNLVNVLLPAVAKSKKYPIRFNHCFARVILDNVVNDIWYKHIEKPAYKRLGRQQLELAIFIGLKMLVDANKAVTYNKLSLQHRGKIICQSKNKLN